MVERIIYRRKKDIADAIASYIWPDGQFEKRLSGKGNGYYRQGDTFVSWAKGHVLALVNPDAYGQQFLKWEEYRCFPSNGCYIPLQIKRISSIS